MVIIKNFQHGKRLLFYQIIFIVVSIVFVILFPSSGFWKDEVSYLGDALSYQRLGWSKEFLSSLIGPPGPLYGVMHGILGHSVTSSPAQVRLFNLGIYLLYAWCVLKLIQRVNKNIALVVSMLLFAIPFNYPVLATALTEAPAYLFQALSVMFLYFYIDETSESKKNIWSVLSGVSLALAFSGRQTTAAIIIGLIYFWWAFKPQLYHIILFVLAALPLPLFLVLQWGGVMAGDNSYLSSGLSFFHLSLSFGYLGFCYFLLNPMVLKEKWLIVLLCGVAFLFLGFLVFPDNRMPLQNTMRTMLPTSLWTVYAKLSCGALAYLGILMIYFIIQQLRYSQVKEKLLFALFAGPILTPLWITHMFSGRYVAMISPMIIYFAVRDAPINGWLVTRCLIGASLGFVATFKYYALF